MRIDLFTKKFLLTRVLNFLRKNIAKNYLIGADSKIYRSAHIYNLLESRNKIIIGENTHIRGELLIFSHGGNITIGDYCYIGENTRIWSAKDIKIGNRVLIAHNCNIFDNDTHPIDPVARHDHFRNIITSGHPKDIDLKEEVVVIEDDVWIGANSTILKGITLGQASIVGAGSVVIKDVKPYSFVAGNPAKEVKRFIKNE